MTNKDREALQAFAQKMQQEGADGFAAGPTPWNNWDDFEEQADSRRTWQGTAKHSPIQETPSRSFGDRVLTTMAVLASTTLVIGIAGVFITQQSSLQLAQDTTHYPLSGPTITTEIQLPPEEYIAFSDTSIGLDGSPALPAIYAESDSLHTALEELPAPAAGTVYRPSGIPAEPAVEVVSEEPPVFREIIMAEPEYSTPVEPNLLSKANLPDVRTEPEQLPIRDISEIQQSVNNGGEWSINLASYLKDSTAEKMRQQFLDKGVVTDMVTATVKGRTYYRLRVTGIENRNMALMQSTIIKEQLGLNEVWITKK